MPKEYKPEKGKSMIDFNKVSQERKKVSAMNKGGIARACGAVMQGKRKQTKFS